MPQVTVVVPTHNPDPVRLRRTLAGLRAQTLPSGAWELLLIDNASSPAVELAPFAGVAPSGARIVREPQLGLTAARRGGFSAAQGTFIVLVDDDNVLAPDYLTEVVRLFSSHAKIGALGGRSLPEFETPPPAWAAEFFPLLALRDLGTASLIAALERAADGTHFLYPRSAPIGAGMALRREAALAWVRKAGANPPTDRRGAALTSGGDNDLVLTLLHAGWNVGYFPELALTHLIPASRLDPGYLARLNRGIQKSWAQVLIRHQACPWPAVPGWSVALRQLKAWFAHRAWSGPAAQIRWQGACGRFEGLGPSP